MNTHQQIRNIIGTLVIDPLDIADVRHMLAARYRHLRADAARPISPPVDDAAVAVLHHAAHRSGRCRRCGIDCRASSRAAATLCGRLEHGGGAGRIKQLTQWGTEASGTTQTQKSLAALWKISQPGVSAAPVYLVRQGYVKALPCAGSEATRYVLSGASRLIFG